MASQDQYSPKFKAKVAREALARDKKNLEPLSDKYDVPVSLILTWAVQLERNAEQTFASTSTPSDIGTQEEEASEEGTVVDVEISDPDISESIEFGAMHDDLDYKTLLYWCAMGVVFIIIFAQLVKFMYGQAGLIGQEANNEDTYYQVEQQKQEARNRITTFGVINLDKGTYRVPIDMVINQMAVDKDSTANTQ